MSTYTKLAEAFALSRGDKQAADGIKVVREALEEAGLQNVSITDPRLQQSRPSDQLPEGRPYITDPQIAANGTVYVYTNGSRWEKRGQGDWQSAFRELIRVIVRVANNVGITSHGQKFLVAKGVAQGQALTEEKARELTRERVQRGRRMQDLRAGGLLYELFGDRDQAGELIPVDDPEDDKLRNKLALPADAAAEIQSAFSAMQFAGRQPITDPAELAQIKDLSESYGIDARIEALVEQAQKKSPGITRTELMSRGFRPTGIDDDSEPEQTDAGFTEEESNDFEPLAAGDSE